MTISTSASRKQYTGNGVTTAFSFPYLVLDEDHVYCYVTTAAGVTTTLALTTGYTIAGVGLQAGITVTTTSAVASGSVLTIQRVVPATQETDYVEGDAFPAASHETALDKLTMLVQQNADDNSRALHLSPTTLVPGFDTELPDPVAGLYWRTNLAGTAMEQVAATYDNGNWTGSGTGAVERTVDSKLGDNVSVKDFGAVGDGVTDDTTAMTAAFVYGLLYGRAIKIPYGNYMISGIAIAISGAGKGPLHVFGEAACDARSTAGRGSLITQIAGNTGDLISFTGDWGTSPNYPIVGIHFDKFSLRTSAACTGWALDLFNVTDLHSSFTNMSVYVPNTAAAGGIRAVSCWCNEFRNLQLFGPGGGTTSRGFVWYGEATGGISDGTPNMTVLENCNAQYFGDYNIQIGKIQETGGGFAQSITIISGQSGHSERYGIGFGRVLDVTVIGHHTEANGYSGWVFNDDVNGNDPTGIKLIACDSYNDGSSATADTADSYGVQFIRGNRIHLDGFRFLLARAGIYVTDSTDVSDIQLDNILFAGDSDNVTSRTALYCANTTPSTDKRVTLGHHSFVYTWGNGGQNVIENPGVITHRRVTEPTVTITDTNDTIAVLYPWSSGFRIAASGAKTLEDITCPTNYYPAIGQVLNLYFNNANTTVKDISSGSGANFKLKDGIDWIPRQYDMLTVEYRDTMWVEVNRSYNSSRVLTHGNSGTFQTNAAHTHTRVTTSGATDLTAISVTGTIPDGHTFRAHFTTANLTLKDVSTTGVINLAGSADYTPPAGTIMSFTWSNSAWYESERRET